MGKFFVTATFNLGFLDEGKLQPRREEIIGGEKETPEEAVMEVITKVAEKLGKDGSFQKKYIHFSSGNISPSVLAGILTHLGWSEIMFGKKKDDPVYWCKKT